MPILGLVTLAGCAGTATSVDPHVYDASGNVATPAPPPPPPQAAAPLCKDAERTVMIDGEPQTVLAYTCQHPDGTWHFVD